LPDIGEEIFLNKFLPVLYGLVRPEERGVLGI